MQSVLDRLIEKISAALIDPHPSDNIYLEQIFTPEIYSEILMRLPGDDVYNFIDHPDAILPDGRKTRRLLDLTDESIQRMDARHQDFWFKMKEILTSTALQKTIMQKFKTKLRERFGDQWPEMVTVPIFYRDYPGYHISVHTDAPYKLATMQFYFPKDNSQIHLGTSFHVKEGNQFRLLKTNPFKPNSAYAFARTETSWHSVKEIPANEAQRDSLALTIYQKGFEYKSSNDGSAEKM